MIKLTEEEWKQVYGILVEECGARDLDGSWAYSEFRHSQLRGTTEFRFGDTLGFGGVLFNSGGRLYVSCYSEDDTPEREAAIEAANARLKKFC